MSGPFESAAKEFHSHGLAPLPLGGSDGKRPLVKNFSKWRRPPSERYVERMVNRFPQANIGLWCGASNLTVLDIDDHKQATDLIARFGDSPVQVETPRGGVHLYFKSAGEGCMNLREYGFEADLKGIGGIIVAPPSVRPTGELTQRTYRLVSGSFDDLARLPTIRPCSLPNTARVRATSGIKTPPSPGVARGQRNTWLFKRLLRDAVGCDSLERLLDVARWLNSQILEPLPEEEVFKIAASAWKVQEDGRNWCGHYARPRVSDCISSKSGEACVPHPESPVLWCSITSGTC